MNEPFARADVLVDADNVSADREQVVEAVVRDARERGYTVRHIHIVGRSIGVLADYERAFRMNSPNADVSAAPAPPGRNAADILAAIWLGRLSCEVGSHIGLYQLYVLTRDKLVLGAARAALGGDKTLVIPGDVLTKDEGSYRRVALSGGIGAGSALLESEVSIPQWASEPPDPTKCVGLHWAGSVEATPIEPPTFVPFPVRLATVRLGGGGGSVDIDLSPWEMPGRRGGLYSPHVVFAYSPAPDSCWTMRATHGHRRGSRKAAMDGVLISAASGAKTLRAGSAVELGNFSFRFHDNPFLSHVWFEDPKNMVERLERGFRQLAEQLPDEAIPGKVRSELSRHGPFSWDHAYFCHYEQAFAAVLGRQLIGWVDKTFRSKGEVRNELGSLNRIRNTVFHPSREPLGESDRERIASLFLRYTRGTANWPT